MGLLIDTDVLILAEREAGSAGFGRWREYGEAYVSVVTASELLVGVHRADTAERRARREAFVEAILSAIPVLDFGLGVARVHARLVASLPTGVTVAAHDAMIGATALYYGCSVLTRNRRDFDRLAGVEVLPWTPAVRPPADPPRTAG